MMKRIISVVLVCIFTLTTNYTLCNTYVKTFKFPYKSELEISKKKIILLTKLINSEAHGESYKSKLLVGSVVLNRTKDDEFPNTLKKVIYQPNQFTGIHSKYFRYSNETIEDIESKKAATYLLKNGSINKRILYFHNPDIVSKNVKPKIIDDNQWFY